MKAVIIEDEKLNAEHLKKLIDEEFKEIIVTDVLRSVEHALEWMKVNREPELIFMDIELSDGTCFDILEGIQLQAKIIFTTAYDQHAIKAFDYNSIAYILKPVTREKLKEAIDKIQIYHGDNTHINHILDQLRPKLIKEHKKRFLVKTGAQFKHIPVENISYFVSEDGLSLAYTLDKKKYFVDYTLDELIRLIDPSFFFRVNRKFIVNLDSIISVKTYFSRRLLIEMTPSYTEDIIVSKERVKQFKSWLDS
jgi:two-component system response regulator LytT